MPTNAEIKLTDEFASAMQQLSAEAEKTIAPVLNGANAEEQTASAEVAEGVGALNDRMKAMEEMLAERLEKLSSAQPAESPELAAQLRRMDEHLMALRNTESVNHRLFNNLHQELKSYRDNFLRDSLQKPFIRDLIVLFDDLSSLATQMQNTAPPPEAKRGALHQWCENLENSIHSVVEIMNRMEVNEIEQKEMVDRTLHKVVSYEPADFVEDDGRIVMRVRRGFVWRGQVLRPEEVVAKRYS